ncbi:MFS transporter [Streptomyces sioyaensis]|uniref:MFS transporter n=1 Tax=Streptomyces sioyaensis TaxID=67364 RepID=UPI0037D20F37
MWLRIRLSHNDESARLRPQPPLSFAVLAKVSRRAPLVSAAHRTHQFAHGRRLFRIGAQQRVTSTQTSFRSRAQIWRSFSRGEQREVGAVVVSTFQSQTASTLLLMLLSLLALDVSGSSASVPLVVAAGALAPLLFVRVVRTVNRLVDERWVMLLSDVGAFSVSSVLWVLVHNGRAQLWHVYVGMFLFSTFGAFYLPAMREWASGRTGNLEQLTWLNAMLAVATQASVVMGWAVGGVLAASIGIASSLAVCVLSYAFGIVLQFLVFVVINRAPLIRPLPDATHGGDVPNQAPRTAPASAWRDMWAPRRLGLFTSSLLLLELTHTLAFSLFIPLLTTGHADRSWVAGIANASFALAAIVSGVAVSGGVLGRYARSLAPYVVLVGFGIQIVFGLSAVYPVLAICLYTLVGLLSGGDSALQSEVQDRWRPVGSAQAYAVFSAVQGPSQMVGALVLSLLLSSFPVNVLYIATITTCGMSAGVLLLLARLRAPGLTAEHPLSRVRAR